MVRLPALMSAGVAREAAAAADGVVLVREYPLFAYCVWRELVHMS